MKTKALFGLAMAAGLLYAGCTGGIDPANPFLTLAEKTGATVGQAGESGGGGTGGEAQAAFRAPLTITFRNNHPSAELNTSMVAWVDLSSVRTADQQEELINAGYIQLSQQLTIGTAFTLPVGTYVYFGPGTAGATPILLARATAAAENTPAAPTSEAYTFVTPDAILVYAQPPVSCESVAFFYTDQGDPLPSAGGSTAQGGLKTLAQVNVYQCHPFKPGLFVHLYGGALQPNEFLEGEDITFDFNPLPDETGNFCIVTMGTAAAATP
jgi:hypothetical protein